MKKITLFFTLFITFNILIAQNLTTGVISSPFANGRTIKFDVNTTTNIVTMTMVLPNNKWFAVAFSNKTGGIQLGQNMGRADDDVILGLNSGVQDRNMIGGTLSAPPLDVLSNHWNIESNTLNGTTRTIIATRARDTGDVEDFVFPNVAGSLPMLYAQGGTATFTSHNEGRGYYLASLYEDTLSTNDIELTTISLYPNPVSSALKINASVQVLNQLTIQVYNVLGEKVLEKKLSQQNFEFSVSDWSNGVYVMKITSSISDKSIVKRFVKI